ncbi:ATP-dependent Clp protease proteolytic subunit [Candidatus Saccharibacteria bacterium]|nr:ATP-dependent Clp protease proteolytic subunit [Candidatus Saccharibacteria bacterium]
MSRVLPMSDSKLVMNIAAELHEYRRVEELDDRRLYLYGAIESIDAEDKGLYYDASMASSLVEHILEFNRQDEGLRSDERKPIRLYINSPGGNIAEGFALVAAIELSKTPVYTVNVGQWSSMAFLIGICGHKRFSLPNMTFLMHDGATAMFGSTNKVQDRIDFEKRFEQEVIRRHVLKHSNMDQVDYDALARVELYLLPEDAIKRGFIDEIVTDIDAIL